jgi:hypothetical protein
MASATERRLEEAVQQMLRPGESIEAWGRAVPGPNPTSSMLKSMRRFVGLAMKVPLRRFVVLTDQRLLMLAESPATGRPKSELVFEAPRESLRIVAEGKGALYRWLELGWEQQTESTLRLNFPRVQWKAAVRFAELLGGGPVHTP